MFLHCAAHLALALAPFVVVVGCCQSGQHDSHSVLVSLSPSFPIPFSVSLSVCLWHCSAFVWRLSVGIEAIRLFKYPVNYETDSADSALIPAKRCILMEF